MSTIVVVRKDDLIAIAADTLTKAGHVKVYGRNRRDHDKIFRFRDTYIGTVGAIAHEDVLWDVLNRYSGEVSFANREAIFQTYLKLHPILKQEYFINPVAEKDDDYESSQIEALVANPNGIFGMYTWRTIIEYERFYAIGSGREYALGAMQAVYDSLSADKIAQTGVVAACEFDENSDLPFTLYSFPAAADIASAASIGG